MKKDPVCGMEVDEGEAKKKNLVVKKEDKEYYFCREDCKGKFQNKKEVWYRSEKFGKIFPFVLGFILIGGSLASYFGNFMTIYMGIFFIIFSLMKMPDWKGFVEAFSKYDLIAKRVRLYGFMYPVIEFSIGVLYLTGIFTTLTAWTTIIVMGIGSIGVGKNMMSKDKFQCACLGTKINVPLTKVTLLENILMVLMAIMLLLKI